MSKLKTLARAATRFTAVEYGLIAGLIVAAGLFAAKGPTTQNSAAAEVAQR